MAEEQSTIASHRVTVELRTVEDWLFAGRRWLLELEKAVRAREAADRRGLEQLERARAGWEADALREAKNAADWREAAEAAQLELEQAGAAKARLVEVAAKAAADLVVAEAELAEVRDLRLKGVTRISELEVELAQAHKRQVELLDKLQQVDRLKAALAAERAAGDDFRLMAVAEKRKLQRELRIMGRTLEDRAANTKRKPTKTPHPTEATKPWK